MKNFKRLITLLLANAYYTNSFDNFYSIINQDETFVINSVTNTDLIQFSTNNICFQHPLIQTVKQ